MYRANYVTKNILVAISWTSTYTWFDLAQHKIDFNQLVKNYVYSRMVARITGQSEIDFFFFY